MQHNAFSTYNTAPAFDTSVQAGTSPAETHQVPGTRIRSAFMSLLVACTLALGGVALPTPAYGVTTEIDAEPDEYQQKIEQTSETYDKATARVAELEQQIADNEKKIAQIEADLPDQMERGADAWRALYLLQRESGGLIEFILNAENFNEFLISIEYLDRIQQQNASEIDQLKTMKSELDAAQTSLTDAKAQASQEQESAEAALKEAQALREEAQRKAQEDAARQAEQAAAATPEAKAQNQETNNTAPGEQEATPEPTPPQNESPSTPPAVVEPPTSDNADWSSDKATFVAQWSGRIDAYLAGSPLAGQGATFASAAWDYGVDPRWSPAISNTESTKGAYCFRPYNAWGWGNISWGSWEEAIDAHVRGLARGYGYTISVEAAKKYCPPNWEHWYNVTLAQMNMI